MSQPFKVAAASTVLVLAGAALSAPASAAPPTGAWDIDPTLEANYEPQRLATNGEDGFDCYRIPALTTANDGTVLASWDGRPDSCADAPNPNSIVLRTSGDDGETWSEPEVIAEGIPGEEKVGYSDPSFVVDRETGEIFNFFVKSYDWAWHQSGNNPPGNERQVMHAVYISSTDNGKTWSEPVEVTEALDPGGEGEVFNARFAASGEGIQLQYGENAGRLIQQYTVRDITKDGGMYAVSLYSDDHGETWQAGEPVGPGMDENKVVELSDGRVMLNSRSSVGGGMRWVAYSDDGGETYSEPVREEQLPDPANNASIIRAYPSAPQGSAEAKVLLFSNAATTSGRNNGTITVSFDDGETWSDRKVFAPGAMSYSTLTTLADGSVGLLFEPGGSNIEFAKFTWAWLEASGTVITAGEEPLNRGEGTVSVTIARHGFDGETPAGELQLTSGAGLASEPVAVPAIPAGESRTVEVPVTIGEHVDPGTLSVTAEYAAGPVASSENLELPVELREGEFPSAALPQSEFEATDVSTPQPGEGPENMFDGDPETLYHTAYDETVVPGGFTVDLGAEHDLAYVSLTPRPDGANGTIGEYRILTGNDPEALTEQASGTWPADSSVRNVYLDGAPGRYVQVEALSSYGDTPDKWISVAEFNARAVGVEPQEELLDIGFELADEPQRSYAVGDSIPVDITVANPTSETLDAVPREGDWEGLFPGCRYVAMAPGFEYTCSANYPVSESDLDRGYVDLVQTWAVDDLNTAQNPATDPIQELTVEGPRVNLGIHAENIGATDLPDEIGVGTEIAYTFEFTNTTNATVAMVPLEGDFAGFHIDETPNCRYGDLTPSADPRTCTTAVYTVTAEDAAAGTIAPPAKFAVGHNTSGEDPFFVLDVPAPEITFDPVVDAVTIVDVAGVDSVDVPFGTSVEDARAALPSTTTLTDSAGESHEVSLNWEIEDYDGETPGEYAATGAFELPEGVEQADPEVPLVVTAAVNVSADEDSDGDDGAGDDNTGDDGTGDDGAGDDNTGDDGAGDGDSTEDLPSTGIKIGAATAALALVLLGVTASARSRKQA